MSQENNSFFAKQPLWYGVGVVADVLRAPRQPNEAAASPAKISGRHPSFHPNDALRETISSFSAPCSQHPPYELVLGCGIGLLHVPRPDFSRLITLLCMYAERGSDISRIRVETWYTTFTASATQCDQKQSAPQYVAISVNALSGDERPPAAAAAHSADRNAEQLLNLADRSAIELLVRQIGGAMSASTGRPHDSLIVYLPTNSPPTTGVAGSQSDNSLLEASCELYSSEPIEYSQPSA